ncbi:MAG: tripartite tricarboxylate transporter substrate binding protein [Clostridia bacterium]|jgi:tripartite-type tricarboxylate transporter receptor subunit TctC|nr:tripartite tricarboxylate transporter substrate binding protein [Spirochaetia bacterium]
MGKKRLIAIVAMVLIAAMSVSAEGQAETTEQVKFPTKPLRVLLPWAAGGSSDIMLRALAELSPKYFGQPMIVVNRDGAGGTIGAAEFVSADPDGHNLMMLAIGVFTTQPFMRDVQYKLDDFEGIIGLSYEPIIFAVNKDSPYNSIEELVADAKKTGKAFKYGSSGSGSLPHLSQAAFFGMAGIKADVVAFAGGNPTITALLGGHIDVAAAHPTEILPFAQDGQLKMLGIFSSERDPRPALKDVPSFKEKGYDINMAVWKFLLVPKGTPKEIKDQLHEGFLQIVKDEKFAKFAETAGLIMNPYSGDELIERIRAEAEFTHGVLKQLGLAKN